MQLTSKQTLLFKADGKENFILSNSDVVVLAPDWIKSTPLYKLALADGTIVEYSQVSGKAIKQTDQVKEPVGLMEAK